jgi:hypothetical protein
MAAIIMIAEVGDNTVVSGMSIAMAEDGPMPGKTPTRVPIRQPTNAQNKFIGASADPNPWIRKSQENNMQPPPKRGVPKL